MSYSATAYRVMIASPSDTKKEREAIKEAIHKWNDINSLKYKLVLLPVGYDTHVTPEVGKHPQDHINDSIVDTCDILVGAFKFRIGTKTPNNDQGGSVEELTQHVANGKPALLYFSNEPLPRSHNKKQFAMLQRFEKSMQGKSLYHKYENIDGFKSDIYSHLQLLVNKMPDVQNNAFDSSNDIIDIDDKSDLKNNVNDNLLSPYSVFLKEINALKPIQLSEEANQILVYASNNYGVCNVRRFETKSYLYDLPEFQDLDYYLYDYDKYDYMFDDNEDKLTVDEEWKKVDEAYESWLTAWEELITKKIVKEYYGVYYLTELGYVSSNTNAMAKRSLLLDLKYNIQNQLSQDAFIMLTSAVLKDTTITIDCKFGLSVKSGYISFYSDSPRTKERFVKIMEELEHKGLIKINTSWNKRDSEYTVTSKGYEFIDNALV